MSQSNTVTEREVAHRVFATELNDATHTFREEDDEMAPVYALLPTGVKANRIFIVGTLTDTENIGNDEDYFQGRVVDSTGTFFVYAGKYQQKAEAFLRDAEPPTYVSITGKPRTYETDDGSVRVSVRPEHISEVDESTRHRWISETATRTLDRIDAFDDQSDPYTRMAREQYGDDVNVYRDAVIEGLQSLED